jgi:hypothetical protein
MDARGDLATGKELSHKEFPRRFRNLGLKQANQRKDTYEK